MSKVMLERGGESPFASPGVGVTSVMFLVEEFLTVVIQVPDPTADDLAFVDGLIQGIGWMKTADAPIGFLMLLLTDDKGGQWPIYGPICGSPASFSAWGSNSREDNLCIVLLVDSNTNLIASGIRSFGLPSDLLSDLRQTCKTYSAADNQRALATFVAHGFDAQSLWNEMRHWIYRDDIGEFIET